jgi:excisionase family DNA binding protein
MPEMLTAKDMQELLKVDRSTIYRMAEAGRLPAIKVGKQWRFPEDQVALWFKTQAVALAPPPRSVMALPQGELASLLPLECVQLIQDAFAEVLGVTLIVTDMEGRPITEASNPGPIYHLFAQSGNHHQICQEKWKELGQIPAMEPRFLPGMGDSLCARALVRLGNELKAMVIVCGILPPDWKPISDKTPQLAHLLGVSLDTLQDALLTAPVLSPDEQKRALAVIQRIADIMAHIGNERMMLLARLSNIAELSTVE